MTRNRTKAGPRLKAPPQLHAFEDRAVPAQLGLEAAAESVAPAAPADGVATVEARPVQPDTQLKTWLSEDSLYFDHSSTAETASDETKLEQLGPQPATDDTTSVTPPQDTLPDLESDSPPADLPVGPIDTSTDEPVDPTEPPVAPPATDSDEEKDETKPEVPVTIPPVEAPPENTAPPEHQGETSSGQTGDQPADQSTGQHDPRKRGIVAPVADVAGTPLTAHGADRLLSAGDLRATDAPLAGPRTTQTVPDLTVAVSDERAAQGDEVVALPEMPVPMNPAVPAVPANEADAPWVPAAAQAADLVSRFVPIDPKSVEESVDQFLAQLRDARDLALSPHQAGLLTSALAAGLVGGEFARRRRLPQRVSKLLSRSRLFSGTKTV